MGILTVDEKYFLRPLWRRVLDRLGERVDFVYEVPFRTRAFPLARRLAFGLCLYRSRLLAAAFDSVRSRVASATPPQWLRSLANSAACQYRYETTFSNNRLADFIGERRVDLVLCQVPYLLRPNVLRSCPFGCWNKHFGKLPEARGSLPFLHTLSEGATHLHFTVYQMSEELDCGSILSEGAALLRKRQSLFRQLSDLNARAAEGMTEAVLRLEQTGTLPVLRTAAAEFAPYRVPPALSIFAKFLAIELRIWLRG